MERVYIKDIHSHTGEKILLQGFVENFRDGKAMAFIVMKDITGKVQITIEKEKLSHLLPALEQITQDSVNKTRQIAKTSFFGDGYGLIAGSGISYSGKNNLVGGQP